MIKMTRKRLIQNPKGQLRKKNLKSAPKVTKKPVKLA